MLNTLQLVLLQCNYWDTWLGNQSIIETGLSTESWREDGAGAAATSCVPWGAMSWDRAGSPSCTLAQLSGSGAKPGHLQWWTSYTSALQPPLSQACSLSPCYVSANFFGLTLRLSDPAQSNAVSPWFTWWHSQSEQLIITNKAVSFLSVLCGMCSTLPTLQAAPGFSWLHCTCDSCLSNVPPESFTCFVVNTQALRRREVLSFIYFGHDFAPSRAEFHSFCCSVILRDTSSEPAILFHLHSCGDI